MEEIVIKTVLDLSESAQKMKQDVTKALNSPEIQTKAREVGRKVGESLSLGIETGRNRQGAEQKETAHQRRLEAIHLQSAARLQQIEARKQAALDLIRERALQKELEHQRKIEREAQRAANSLGSIRSAIAGVQGALAATGVGLFFESLARRSLDAAINMDRFRGSLQAFTGSAQAAERRLAALIELARKTPGLTTNLAATLDIQLRTLNVAEQTINRLLPTIGRLNAISPIGDARQFAANLGQLASQGFEKQDLKELVGQSPLAGELIKEIFGVNNPTNAKAIRAAARKLGIDTAEELFTAFAKAGENNKILQGATENLETQFEKLRGRIDDALAPLGNELAKSLLPLLDDVAKRVETVGPTMALRFREVGDEIRAISRALLSLGDSIGMLIGWIDRLGQAFNVNRLAFRSLEASLLLLTGGAAGPFINRIERELSAGDAQRTQQNRAAFGGAPSRFGLFGATRPPSRTTGGGGIGSDIGGGRARRLTLPTLTESDLVTSQFEGEEDFRFVEAARARGRELRQRLTLESEQARRNLINEGRDTRRRLTAEADERAIAEIERTSRRGFSRSGRFIGDAVNRGLLTGGEAELLSQGAAGQFANNLREVLALKERILEANDPLLNDLRDEIELYDRLSVSVSNSERFMRGFNSQVETVGDAFERFGANVSNAFRNVRDLFNGLKQAVLGFFNDLVGNSLQNLMRQFLAPVLGGVAGVFGGPAAAGAAGNIFRTPGIAQAFAATAGGGGITAPASISQSFFGTGRGLPIPLGPGASGGAGVRPGDFFLDPGFVSEGASKFSLSGIGKSIGAAAPFLGLSLGGTLGGQSAFGQILGSAGGFLAGGAVAGAIPGLLGAKAAAFFTNPFTIAIGAGLLVGSVLLGKAAQRKRDEEASGQMLTAALQGIEQLAQAASSGQIVTVSEARALFENNVLGQFIQGIKGLKTESVRKSRLTNQVADLRRVFEDRVPPLISQRDARAADSARFASIDRQLIPEFASGGIVPGVNRGRDSVMAFLTPGELVLNRAQQSRVMAQAGPDVFDRAGVPRVNLSGRFADGGVAAGGGSAQEPIVVEVDVRIGMTDKDAQQIFVRGGSTSTGRNVIVRQIRNAQTNREL